ncbi:MAG: hypothetical protein ACD_75C00289G0002 [uncultured bacterium]|nr:MAG: hypothetical protein ACD_75C00289G0002 [uncultured bacterium]
MHRGDGLAQFRKNLLGCLDSVFGKTGDQWIEVNQHGPEVFQGGFRSRKGEVDPPEFPLAEKMYPAPDDIEASLHLRSNFGQRLFTVSVDGIAKHHGLAFHLAAEPDNIFPEFLLLPGLFPVQRQQQNRQADSQRKRDNSENQPAELSRDPP